MARVELTPEDGSGPAELVERIRARRGGRLLELDRMLLHVPAFARGWNELLGAVRTELDLPPLVRELVICAVAVLNGARYEFAQHAPEFLRAGGTMAGLAEVQRLGEKEFEVATLAGLSDDERAALQLAVEMTRGVAVRDQTFEAVRRSLGTEERVVALVGVIATYNMVSRFLVALEIEPD